MAPCQGEGREFESRRPLQYVQVSVGFPTRADLFFGVTYVACRHTSPFRVFSRVSPVPKNSSNDPSRGLSGTLCIWR